MRIYRFSCGCITEGVKKSGNTVYCLEHPEARAVVRVFKCVDCEKMCEGPVRSNHERCPECSAAKQKKDKQDYYRKYIKGKAINNPPTRYLQRSCIRNQDCLHYPECMAFGGELMKNAKACVDCSRYTPVSIEALLAHELAVAVA